MAIETSFRSDEMFTQDEFLAWLEERPISDSARYELVRGRIVVTPPAGWPHGGLEARITSLLERYVRANRLGLVQGSSAGYDLPSGDTLAPDVSFISLERFAAGPPPVAGRFVGIVPNLAVEILSRSTARRDRGEKREIYEACAVEEYWLVDPEQRQVIVFAGRGGRFGARRVLAAGTLRSSVLPGLEIALDDIFDLLP